MKINDYIEQTTAEFKERQSHWHQFEGHSLDELELVEKPSASRSQNAA